MEPSRGETSGEAAGGPLVIACIVTWNRPREVAGLLEALRGQVGVEVLSEIVVVDNASEPPVVVSGAGVSNVVEGGLHDDDFVVVREPEEGVPRVTVVRSELNLGGCGGFNLAMSGAMLWAMGRQGEGTKEKFLWLLDDDARPAPDAMVKLLDAALSDASIGIVGSRMVDPKDGTTTLEGPVYLDRVTGLLAPEPGKGNQLRAGFDRDWAKRDAPGLIEADVVAACSMLARASVLERIGYWDSRYFIANDDAEWCLRARRAGFRVVCAPAAVVYHAPWNRKRSPERDYYRRRNMFWLWQRHLPREDYLRLAQRRGEQILRQSWKAIGKGRLRAAEIQRRTLNDAMRSKGGKLEVSVPSGAGARLRLRARWVGTFIRFWWWRKRGMGESGR